MNTNKLICNKWQCPDGTILQSRYRHDYVYHVDAGGNDYFVDGGTDYSRVSGNMTSLCVYDCDTHDKIRENFEWTSYGRNGDEEAHNIFLKDLTSEHITNILRTQTRLAEHIKKIFSDELLFRSI